MQAPPGMFRGWHGVPGWLALYTLPFLSLQLWRFVPVSPALGASPPTPFPSDCEWLALDLALPCTVTGQREVTSGLFGALT